jgi:D-glycero-alpha-D-manno-heptose-7-phosphate kinase
MIISRTPFRISFFGGGTDYPAWYAKNGGAVLATTIDKYCYLTCRYLPPFFEHRIRVVYSKVENCQTVEEIEHPAVREVLRYLNVDRGVEIHHDGDLPARSGMGTSSSFTVGLLHALYALKGQMPTKRQLSMESIYIEQERLRETVGSQDQILAAHGGFNHIIFHKDDNPSVRPVILPAERNKELQDHLMLLYTGIARTSSHIANTYVPDLPNRERQLHAMTAMVDEAVSILHSGQDIARFGRLLDEGWQTKRGIGAMVSNSAVDEIYQQAISAGAIGGKLLGAGGGGFMLLFVPPSSQPKVRERLNKLVHVPFRFESSGSQIIFFDQEPDYSAEDRFRTGQTVQAFRELAFVDNLETAPEEAL